MKDLSALPPDAPEHALATPVLQFIMATQNIVQELVEKGRREALRDMQELVEKGRREGRLEGQRDALRKVEKRVDEGRLMEARAALRAVLTKRGLSPSAEDEAKIDACTRTATLRRWLDQAIDATSLAEALK